MSHLLLLHHLEILYTELRKTDKTIIYHPIRQNELNFMFSTIKKWYQSQHSYPDPFCLDQLNSTFDIHQKQKKNMSLLAMTHPRSFHVYTSNNSTESPEIPQVDPIDTCIGMLRYLNYEKYNTLSAHHVLMPFIQAIVGNSKVCLISLRAIHELLPKLIELDEFEYCVKIISRNLTKLVPKGNEDVLGILQLLLDIFKLLLDFNMDSEQYTWWISTLLGYIVGKLPDGLKFQAEQCILDLVDRSWNDPASISNILRMLLSPILPKAPFQVCFSQNSKLKTLYLDYQQYKEAIENHLMSPVIISGEPLGFESEGLQNYVMRLLEKLNITFYIKNPLVSLEYSEAWQKSLKQEEFVEVCLRVNGLRSVFRLLYHPTTSFPIRFQAFKTLSFIILNNYKNPNYKTEIYVFFSFLIDAIGLLGPNPATLTHPRVSQSKFKPKQVPSYLPNSNMSSSLSTFFSPFTTYSQPIEDEEEAKHMLFPSTMPRTYPLWVSMQAVESGDTVRTWSYTNIFLHWFDIINEQENKLNTLNDARSRAGKVEVSLKSFSKPAEIPNSLYKRMWHSHGIFHRCFKQSHYFGPFTYFGSGVVHLPDKLESNRLEFFDSNGPFPAASFLKSFIISTIKDQPKSQEANIALSDGKYQYFKDPLTEKTYDDRIAVSNEVVEWRNAIMETIETIFVDSELILAVLSNFDYNGNDNLFQRFLVAVSKFCVPDYMSVCSRSFCAVALSSIFRLLKQFTTLIDPAEAYDESLSKQLYRKQIVKTCSKVFDRDIKKGLELFQAYGFLPENLIENSSETAIFLKSCKNLSKSKLGEFLGKPQNLPILKEFVNTFDFSHDRVDEALRDFLTSFRLPGESQQIERILECFAARYFGTKPKFIANQDAVLILAYSIVMLNTDSHSPQIKQKMTLSGFQNNLRGTNNNENFDPEFLKSIYEAIKMNEIIMPGEKDNDQTYFLFWDEVQQDTSRFEQSKNKSNLIQSFFRDNWGLWLSVFVNGFYF
eukprot:NODE_159_length_15043_cov_0.440444.p1 type:complete len:996 gc:universal NODE_159_length_15043_cov_0.440444:3576-6563(+)